MWVAVVFIYSKWSGVLLDRFYHSQFETQQECYEYRQEYIKSTFASPKNIGCYKLENAPEEYHKE